MHSVNYKYCKVLSVNNGGKLVKKLKVKVLTITIVLLSLLSQILVACTADISQNTMDENADAITNVDQTRNIQIKDSYEIDFSNVEFIKSEICPDPKIAEIVYNYFYKENEELNGKYLYNYIDLNGDGKDEAFVFLFGPDFSGTGGNTGLILQENDCEYSIIQKFTLVRNPIIISDDKTNDWNDIIMKVSGGGIPTSYNILKHDGKQYPSNPSLAPKLESGTVVNGVGIISDELSRDIGFEIN